MLSIFFAQHTLLFWVSALHGSLVIGIGGKGGKDEKRADMNEKKRRTHSEMHVLEGGLYSKS